MTALKKIRIGTDVITALSVNISGKPVTWSDGDIRHVYAFSDVQGQPVAEIAEAAAQGAEITTELNGQELTITAHEPENMEAAFNVTGERRKALVETVKAFVDAPAVYQNAPSFAYVIGDYTVSKTGTISGPANEALMAALNAKGFIVE